MTATCLLFDLDGTLIDSLPDLTTAINLLRADFALAALEPLQVREFVGDGATSLVKRALPEGRFDAQKLTIFLDYYQKHLNEGTRPYPGIPEMLEKIKKQPMAVVTNKPEQMAMDLLSQLKLKHFFRCVLGGDSCIEKKPHPQPVLEALGRLSFCEGQAVMIGDHHTDLRAAQAAGIDACFCSWGYGNDGGETPKYRVHSVSDLCQLLAEE